MVGEPRRHPGDERRDQAHARGRRRQATGLAAVAAGGCRRSTGGSNESDSKQQSAFRSRACTAARAPAAGLCPYRHRSADRAARYHRAAVCLGPAILLCLHHRDQSMAGPAVLIRADRKFPFAQPGTAFRSRIVSKLAQ